MQWIYFFFPQRNPSRAGLRGAPLHWISKIR